jgi:hypothetical protein
MCRAKEEMTMNHFTIYREPGRYAGWPANYGIWAWDHEIVLGFTLGYPRTVQRPDRTIVTAYYFNDTPDSERYIAATLWKP